MKNRTCCVTKYCIELKPKVLLAGVTYPPLNHATTVWQPSTCLLGSSWTKLLTCYKTSTYDNLPVHEVFSGLVLYTCLLWLWVRFLSSHHVQVLLVQNLRRFGLSFFPEQPTVTKIYLCNVINWSNNVARSPHYQLKSYYI